MKLQNLSIIFIIIILPIILVLSAYIGYEIKTINQQNAYNTGLVSATHDAVFAFELNTKNDIFSNNAENKRSNIRASIKTFENSLSTTCNLGLYNNEAIEEYIPAIAFCLYDGFYMYSPTQTQDQGYKHELRNYVYYSEPIKKGNIDVVVRYSLDNYIAVSGYVGNDYVTRAGYLINLSDLNSSIKDIDMETAKEITYKGNKIKIEEIEEYVGPYDESGINRKVNSEDKSAIAYFKDAYVFTDWFMNEVKIGQAVDYLNINSDNDPEDENSKFVQHKREIIKEKIENTLNSSITAYANKTRNNYKMPKFSEDEWDKIYNNVSVISFVQGLNLGFKNYNNYCILSSTNNQEYVNPNLIYFSDKDNYHDIRCGDIKDKETTGYKIGSFEKVRYEKKDETDNTQTNYYYKHNELACYNCINGSNIANSSIYDYVRDNNTSNAVKSSYFSALARERYRTNKLLNSYNAEYIQKYTIKYEPGDREDVINVPANQTANIGQAIEIDGPPEAVGYDFVGWMEKGNQNAIHQPGEAYFGWGDITFVAKWEIKKFTVRFDTNGGDNTIEPQIVSYGRKVTKPNDPIKTDYTFLGWYTEIGLINEFDFDTPIKDNITLYAKWKRNAYTVTFDSVGGTYINPVKVEYGNKVTEPVPPTRVGYDFDGWYKDYRYYNKFDFSTPITEDMILYAKWKTKVVTINYYVDNKLIDTNTTNYTSTFSPVDIVNGLEGYENSMLLGYRINNGGRVNYGDRFEVSKYSNDGNPIKLDAIYIGKNSIKCIVTVPSGTNNQDNNNFYTNTTGSIKAEIKSENNNGSPKITSQITGSNTSKKNGNNYTIYSTNETTNTIQASMILTEDNVSRTISETFYITVDRTAPVLNSAIYEYYWLRFTLLCDITETNLKEIHIGNTLYSAAYSRDGNMYRATGLTFGDCYNTTVYLVDRAGNRSVNYYVENGQLKK